MNPTSKPAWDWDKVLRSPTSNVPLGIYLPKSSGSSRQHITYEPASNLPETETGSYMKPMINHSMIVYLWSLWDWNQFLYELLYELKPWDWNHLQGKFISNPFQSQALYTHVWGGALPSHRYEILDWHENFACEGHQNLRKNFINFSKYKRVQALATGCRHRNTNPERTPRGQPQNCWRLEMRGLRPYWDHT